MASSFLALFDDIASILDDVSLMTKVAAKKTAGVLGDDLALNAEQVSGIKADRELPVVWAVAKGSFKNKLILVPAALLISAFIPWLIMPLLMIGGAYLCFEGTEKLVHVYFHSPKEKSQHRKKIVQKIVDAKNDLLTFEKEKIQGAIRTDFVLSTEIIVIALGTVKDADFITQIIVVSLVATLITIGVYGLVAAIVKLDDGGLALIKSATQNRWGKIRYQLGTRILWFAPFLMKSLSVIGTIAMFLVGGGIIMHGIPLLHEITHPLLELAHSLPYISRIVSILMPLIINIIAGILIGGIVLMLVSMVNKLRKQT